MVVKKNKPKVNIVFKSILGIVILLIVFSLIVSMMGFRNCTVDEFVGDAPQFDDLTMLGVKLL